MTNTPSGLLFGAALLLSVTAGASAASGGPVSERLQVRSAHGKVLVRVTLENRSAQAVYVPKAIATSGTLSGKLFEIEDTADGTPVMYVGMMVKRGPLGADDFVTLAPHAQHRNTIDITSDYAFKDGTHRYRIKHEGSYLTGLAAVEAATPMPVASAEFQLTAP